MAISPQRLTVYLYSAHRAVIFAIAQLSCYFRSTSVFGALEVFYENALYKFTFDIDIDIDMMFMSAESERPALTNREIIFEKFQPM